MTRLSDIQLILLTTASQRPDGNLLPLPDSISDAGTRLQKGIAGLLKRSLAVEAEVAARAPSWREDGDARFGLTITDAGRAAIGVAPPGEPGTSTDRPPQGGRVEDSQATDVISAPAAGPGASFARAGSKQATIIELLQRESGATITDLADATGWLPHTTRAALTGLRKRGLQINKEKVDGVTRYRTVAEPAA